MDSRETILKRLRKVFALAENAGTEGEAMAAMARAQEILGKHKLEMSDVLGVEEADEKPSEKTTEKFTKNFSWQHLLHGSACRLFFCSCLRLHDGRRIIIGKKTDIAAAEALASYLLRLGKEGPQKDPGYAEAQARDLHRQFANSWRVGFASRIATRVSELITPKSEEKGLILHPLYNRASAENKQYLDNHYSDRKADRSRVSVSNAAGYARGQVRANSVVLSRQGSMSGRGNTYKHLVQ